MKRASLIAIVLLTGLQAASAQQPQQYAPITIDNGEYSRIMQYLLEQPAKFSMPLINRLNFLEQAAVKAAQKETGKDASEPDKP